MVFSRLGPQPHGQRPRGIRETIPYQPVEEDQGGDQRGLRAVVAGMHWRSRLELGRCRTTKVAELNVWLELAGSSGRRYSHVFALLYPRTGALRIMKVGDEISPGGSTCIAVAHVLLLRNLFHTTKVLLVISQHHES